MYYIMLELQLLVVLMVKHFTISVNLSLQKLELSLEAISAKQFHDFVTEESL